MGKTLLCIHAHGGIDDMIARHYATWLNSNADDLLGIGRVDAQIRWPNSLVTHDIGKQGNWDSGNLPSRLIETLRYVLASAKYNKFDDIVVTEADSIFFAPLRKREGDFESIPFINEDPRFSSPVYYHPYWRFGRSLATQVVKWGNELLSKGRIENGFPDRFLGLVLYSNDVKASPAPAYSCNAFDEKWRIEDCRQQVKDGKIIFAHGVKTKEQLEALTK